MPTTKAGDKLIYEYSEKQKNSWTNMAGSVRLEFPFSTRKAEIVTKNTNFSKKLEVNSDYAL
jgi:hypothetical protein